MVCLNLYIYFKIIYIYIFFVAKELFLVEGPPIIKHGENKWLFVNYSLTITIKKLKDQMELHHTIGRVMLFFHDTLN